MWVVIRGNAWSGRSKEDIFLQRSFKVYMFKNVISIENIIVPTFVCDVDRPSTSTYSSNNPFCRPNITKEEQNYHIN